MSINGLKYKGLHSYVLLPYLYVCLTATTPLLSGIASIFGFTEKVVTIEVFLGIVPSTNTLNAFTNSKFAGALSVKVTPSIEYCILYKFEDERLTVGTEASFP